ncbi:STAS domain-containing protein [Thalassoroseus pseudoceratinae]|uniref:STAS domain-containing protein n=1 Tax=Thalassoroseus pseudoceratinae TaxID=2713176 RepID=UPI0014206303|nr:STAS domain-containing protein [Thalassoroseus pseudoceratinae]
MWNHQQQGATSIVSGKGPLNLESVDAASRTFERGVSLGIPRIVFDMNEILLVDSSGLELMLDTLETCENRGGSLRLARPNALCQDILRITEVDKRFEVYSDPVTAAGSFTV